jgi:hypothetical protein
MRPRALRIPAFAVVAALASALAGCQEPDVGQRCRLTWGTDPDSPPPTPQSAAGDFFESGNVACEGLVCIVSPESGTKYDGCGENGDICGYCSKACVSDEDCFTDDTGLVCNQLVLDPAFIATLDEQTKERFLADVRFTSYCVAPR